MLERESSWVRAWLLCQKKSIMCSCGSQKMKQTDCVEASAGHSTANRCSSSSVLTKHSATRSMGWPLDTISVADFLTNIDEAWGFCDLRPYQTPTKQLPKSRLAPHCSQGYRHRHVPPVPISRLLSLCALAVPWGALRHDTRRICHKPRRLGRHVLGHRCPGLPGHRCFVSCDLLFVCLFVIGFSAPALAPPSVLGPRLTSSTTLGLGLFWLPACRVLNTANQPRSASTKTRSNSTLAI